MDSWLHQWCPNIIYGYVYWLQHYHIYLIHLSMSCPTYSRLGSGWGFITQCGRGISTKFLEISKGMHRGFVTQDCLQGWRICHLAFGNPTNHHLCLTKEVGLDIDRYNFALWTIPETRGELTTHVYQWIAGQKIFFGWIHNTHCVRIYTLHYASLWVFIMNSWYSIHWLLINCVLSHLNRAPQGSTSQYLAYWVNWWCRPKRICTRLVQEKLPTKLLQLRLSLNYWGSQMTDLPILPAQV